jgi:hypothetical protein
MAANFSSSGAQVLFSFNASTDRGGLAGAFPCSRLLNFTDAPRSQCAWQRADTLVATLPSGATLLPGGNVTVLPSKLRAECTSPLPVTTGPWSSANCTGWSYAPPRTVTIRLPSDSLVPKPLITYSAAVSVCDSVVIDASRSTGSGGRALSYQWMITPPQESSQAAYNVTGGSVLTLTASSSNLTRGEYSIRLVLQNFLGYRSYGIATVQVVASALPNIVILGPETVFASQVLTLYGKASPSACASSSSLRLSYLWYQTGLSTPLVSSSLDPRFLRLAANTLTAGRTYYITLRVSDANGATNNATTTVQILETPLVASIRGTVQPMKR